MPTTRRATSGQRGFTLLELLITLSITTIGLIGLLSLHLSITRGNDGASRAAEAQQITASTLEALRGLRIANGDLMRTLTGNPAANPPVVAAAVIVPGRAGANYSVVSSVTALPAAPALWRIRVQTSWTEDGAVAGANGGQLDHTIALEIIRTMQESL